MHTQADRNAVIRRGLAGLSEFMSRYGDESNQNQAIDEALDAADARMKREIHVTLKTLRVVSNPDPDAVAGIDYDVEEEPYDYHRSQYGQFGYLRLNRQPVISIQRVRMMFGRDNKLVEYPLQWIRLNKKAGQISIMPTPGFGWSGAVLQTGQYLLPQLTSGWIRDDVPQVLSVDYTAGLGDRLYGDDEMADLRMMRYRLAAQEVLKDLAPMVAGGGVSKSISEDGASESTSYGRMAFSGTIDQIETDWKQFKQSWRDTQAGIRFVAV